MSVVRGVSFGVNGTKSASFDSNVNRTIECFDRLIELGTSLGTKSYELGLLRMDKSLLTRISRKVGTPNHSMSSYGGIPGTDVGLPEVIGKFLAKIPNDIPKIRYEVGQGEWTNNEDEKNFLLESLQHFTSTLVPELLAIYQETFDALQGI